MMIPKGLCVDLETTLTLKIPNHVRPVGEKRYETRLLEIGAVAWDNPTLTFGCLVNPIPPRETIQSPKELFDYMLSAYQHPTRTLQFWSKVLVRRNSLTRDMFLVTEHPEVWLARHVEHRAKDFVRWHNEPSTGPDFIGEREALKRLLAWSKKHAMDTWLAHNGRSFDFKVLEGVAQRHCLQIPKTIKQLDTLHLFRKHVPGHKSYSQPLLYKAIFNKPYNAHVAIDDAKALAKLCKHVATAAKPGATAKPSVPETPPNSPQHPLRTPLSTKKKMDLTFTLKGAPKALKGAPKAKVHFALGRNVQRLRGIGPKTASALSVVGITTVQQLKDKYDKHGAQWLRNILPAGVRWRVIAHSISTA